jgi:hypothetical protein
VVDIPRAATRGSNPSTTRSKLARDAASTASSAFSAAAPCRGELTSPGDCATAASCLVAITINPSSVMLATLQRLWGHELTTPPRENVNPDIWRRQKTRPSLFLLDRRAKHEQGHQECDLSASWTHTPPSRATPTARTTSSFPLLAACDARNSRTICSGHGFVADSTLLETTHPIFAALKYTALAQHVHPPAQPGGLLDRELRPRVPQACVDQVLAT